MLDDVAVGPFAEQPARKDAIPFVVALILHRQLDEGAGFGRILPRRGRLARAQPHDRAADAERFAGLHLELADQPVAFVEQSQHRDAFGHRCRALYTADFLRHRLGARRFGRAARAGLGLARLVAAREQACRHQRRERDGKGTRHPAAQSAPGRQAS